MHRQYLEAKGVWGGGALTRLEAYLQGILFFLAFIMRSR